MTSPRAATVTRQQLASHLGGLNGREPFMAYLLRKAELLRSRGADDSAVMAMVKAEHRFWSNLLRRQMDRYDKMRNMGAGVRRGYALVHFEFDALFRYCDDPVAAFKLDVSAELTESQMDELVPALEAFIAERRRDPPRTRYPISLVGFIAKGYVSVLASLLYILLPRFAGRGRLSRPFWISVFQPTANDRTAGAVIGRWFWICVLITSALVVLVLVSAALTAAVHVLVNSKWAARDIVAFVLLVMILLMFVPVLVRSFCQLGRVLVALVHGCRTGVASIRTPGQLQRALRRHAASATEDETQSYAALVVELYSEHLVTRTEYECLLAEPGLRLPRNARALDRLKRWTNVVHLARSAGPAASNPGAVPVLTAWEDVQSVTILVFTLGERFRHTWATLTATESDLGPHIEPVLTTLVKRYRDEWANFLSHLSPSVDPAERDRLSTSDWSSPPADVQTLALVERWANLKLQTIYNTLEGCGKVFTVYERLAKRLCPRVTDAEARELARHKVQVIWLHDRYPDYGPEDPQKAEIDCYLQEHPDVELRWPRDPIHASKSGAWANVLPDVRGEFLMTLDADHAIAVEELSHLPNVLREFVLQPKVDAIQFRLQTFNERHTLVARCGGLAEDSWYIQDLRAKNVIGGGGVYGKLIYRMASVYRLELVQPDSVGEDMLTMARLQAENAGIRFVEYMQIGQGQELTYGGLKRKYGRYPIGATESSLCRPFAEMLLSPATPWHRKADALFMVSYFPLQVLIVLANAGLLLAFALDLFIVETRIWLAYFAVAYLILLSDTLMSLLNLWERFGVVRGAIVFLRSVIPMSVLHVSLIPHYVQQFRRCLRGYARFNVTWKDSELVEGRRYDAYADNKFTIWVGTAQLALVAIGLMRHGVGALELAALAPFIYNSVIWSIGPFAFIPRRRIVAKIMDIALALPYALGRSCADLACLIGGAVRVYVLRQRRQET